MSCPCQILRIVTLVIAVSIAAGVASAADDFEGPPIHYSEAVPRNLVSELQAKLDAGDAALEFKEPTGWLESLLRELKVPISSQTLVFSKTSLQRHRISPRTPRAIYFSDDVYVGYCQGGEVAELSVVDPRLGTVFYTLNQALAEGESKSPPRFVRQTDNCLQCHASSNTRQAPGHTVRSVFTDAAGMPILSAGGFRTDHSSPFAERWGGWYVTGTHGSQKHMGNMTVRGKTDPYSVDNKEGQNVVDLKKLVDVAPYLSPHSDLVALMVLEHQAEGHNLLTRASFQSRLALHQEQGLNRELGEQPGHRWAGTTSRINSACDELLRYMLFSEEARLAAPVRGTSDFAAEFMRRGPKDSRGRSLRDFDLETRLFKYPCSYLIYSASVAALPEDAKNRLFLRLGEVLWKADPGKEFAHLTPDDRQAIREILLETHPEIAAYWRDKGFVAAP